jgi:MATE family multidrug resistance protein
MAGQTGVRPGRPAGGLDRRIFAIAVPALGALAADPLLSLVDTAFVSGLGTSALAALGVTGAIFGFAFVLFNFLAYATTPLVARAVGAGNTGEVRDVVGRALWLALVLGVASTALLVGLAGPLVRLMQAGPEVIDPALAYLRIRALAAPAVLVVTAGHGVFRGLQDTRTPLLIALGANLVNVVLDPILIYAMGWGVTGAAAASAVAQYTAAGWFLRRLRRRVGGLDWRFPGWREVRPFLRTGGVLTIRTLMLVSAVAVGTAVAAAAGTAQVAAHQVVRETWFLTAMMIDGLAIAGQALIAEQVGRRDSASGGAISRRLLGWGLAGGALLALLWLLAGPGLAALFAPDPGVGRLIVTATRIAAIMAPPAALVWVLDGILLGRLALGVLALSTAAGLGAGGVIFYLTVANGWGLSGVWWGMTAMVVARLVVLWAGYRRPFQAFL